MNIIDERYQIAIDRIKEIRTEEVVDKQYIEYFCTVSHIPNIKIHIAAFAMVPMYVYLINLFSSSKLLMPIPNPNIRTASASE